MTDEPLDDNLEAAMNAVADSIKPTRKPRTGAKDGETADKQVLIRATEEDHAKWKLAAEKAGKSMSEFIRDAVNASAKDIVDCPHPTNMKRFYPWATTCLQCGQKWVYDKRKPRGQNHK